MSKLNKTQAMYCAILDDCAIGLGLEAGVYKPAKKSHDSYTVTLGNGEPVKLPVYQTPANKEGYAGTLPARLRAHIARHLERGGHT